MYLRMFNKDKKSCEKFCGLDPALSLTSVSGSPFTTGATYVTYVVTRGDESQRRKKRKDDDE